MRRQSSKLKAALSATQVYRYVTNRHVQDIGVKTCELPRPAPELPQVCEVCHVPYGTRQGHASQQVLAHLALKHLAEGAMKSAGISRTP